MKQLGIHEVKKGRNSVIESVQSMKERVISSEGKAVSVSLSNQSCCSREREIILKRGCSIECSISDRTGY